MSLGIAFKGPEGIVLAADSRVTLTSQQKHGKETIVLPSTFDNATKILHLRNLNHVGVVTYGLGALGQKEVRTPQSFLPEFEDRLNKEAKDNKKLSVENFAKKLSEFFADQWKKTKMPKKYTGPPMTFLVGGYDENAIYGRIFQVEIPSKPIPKEWHKEKNQFGPVWGGQLNFTNRLIHGFDPDLLPIVKNFAKLSDNQMNQLRNLLQGKLEARIPYQFLSLQDCVNLSKFLIQTTINIQAFYVGVRGVGGSIDVAVITRTEGFVFIKKKQVFIEPDETKHLQGGK